MNRRNRKLAVVVILIIGLMLTACGIGGIGQGSVRPSEDNDKLQVVTTIFPAYDFARQVGGDHVEVRMLLKPGEELHSYEPSPRDIIAIEQCDVFIYVGGESDTWVDDILESVDISETTIISMMEIVEALAEVTVEGMDTGGILGGHSHDHGAGDHAKEEHEHGGDEACEINQSAETENIHDENCDEMDHDHDHVEYDEHVWTSPANAKLIVEHIADAFMKNDPKNEQDYVNHEAAYIGELDKLAKELIAIRESAVRRIIIVGDRFPYRYLAEFMDLDYYAAFPGCAEETEPSARTVAFLIDKVREEQIPVVFHGEFSSHLMAQRIGEEAGAEPMLLHSCHNVTKDEFENGVTYLDLMWMNSESLRMALCR